MSEKGFLTNESSVRFLDKIISDLDSCESFDFSVSFIKKAGLILMQDAIENALKRGAKGRILTSTYQNFTDIPSLEVFLHWQELYPNFECHLEYGSFGDDGFHTKGYIFAFKDHHEVIIGSSNITFFALIKNKEWDLSLEISHDDTLYSEISKEFGYLWDHTNPLNHEIVKQYTEHLKYAIEQWDMDFFDPESNVPIRPNLMQRQALKEIARYRSMDIHKALVVAATGSGKTYLAAFDALNAQAKKLLFVVHKDMILEAAMKTFMHVFGTTRTYGMYTGQTKDGLTADFLFSSNIILANNLNLFDPHEFDYIVIDEVHHAAAETYRKIISYFKPQFLLGLTATPDRMDEQSVYDLFDKNVPYDLRLREALENDLIVPFHYYGIRDSLVNYSDDITGEGVRKMIQEIASNTHCEFIKEQIEKYRPTGTKLKCIGFCRTVEHARLMAQNMSLLGYTCESLSGENTTGERQKVFERLEDESDPLSIVFTVDILNEGIDIPSMNMVLFLRPTESSTIFIQQLGRGLRKYKNKGYLTVLDFIANSYLRSVQIALALGSLSKSGTVDKRTIADHVRTDFSELDLSGLEVHFDKESRDEILNSIEHTNFNRFELLKKDYQNFKEYLKLKPGQYPKHTDFLNSEVSADLLRYTKKFDSYYDFLQKCGEDVPFFNEQQVSVIRTLSWHLPLIRPEEYSIIECLLEGKKSKEELRTYCKLNEDYNDASFAHALRILEDDIVFTRPQSYMALIKNEANTYSLNFDTSSGAFVDWISDLLAYGLGRFASEFYGEHDLLKLYGSYTAPKTFMALNNDNLFYMMGVHYIQGHLCLYVNLNKDSQPEERLKYKDKFLSNKILQWESQTETTMTNIKGQRLINTRIAEIFVRKTKKEDGVETPFVYLGKGTLTNPRPSDNPAKALLFDIVLEQSVPEEYKYDFGIEDTDEKKA
jgi:superfamily II DNA or RNA helicase